MPILYFYRDACNFFFFKHEESRLGEKWTAVFKKLAWFCKFLISNYKKQISNDKKPIGFCIKLIGFYKKLISFCIKLIGFRIKLISFRIKLISFCIKQISNCKKQISNYTKLIGNHKIHVVPFELAKTLQGLPYKATPFLRGLCIIPQEKNNM